jgi:hypothetical protein
MKKLIILLSLILLSSCGSYQLSTVGYTPIIETRVITPVYTTPWYYGLTDPSWRWHYYQRYNTPRVIIVNPKPVVRVRGARGSAGRSNATRSNSTQRRNSNKRN